MQSVTSLAGAGMRVYDKVVHEQVFEKNVLFQNILSNVAKAVGSTTKYFSVHNGRNIGSGAGSETITLPTAGKQKYTQGTIPMRYNFHTISFTDVALKASQKSQEFLVDLMDSEYTGAKNDMQRQMTRQGYGIGTGQIGLVKGDPGVGTTVEVDTPMVGKDITDYIDEDNILRFGATASTIGTVASKTDGDTFELVAGVAAIADNDPIYIARSATESNKDSEIMGLKGLIDNGENVDVLEGVTRSTSIWFKSYINSSVSAQRSLTDALLHTTFLEAKKKGDPRYALTSFDVYSAYGQLLTPDRRYTESMKLNGGFTGVSFSNIPVIADYDCPYDELYFIDNSVLSSEDLSPMSFLNEDGSILARSSTTPAWNATLTYYANLAIKAPNKCSALRDIIA